MIDKLKMAWDTFHPRSFTVSLRKQHPDVYKWVLEYPMPVPTKTVADRAFIILNPTRPRCHNTGCLNEVASINREGWALYCSSNCKGQHNSAKSRDKAKNTSIKNWGVDNPAKNIIVKNKMKATMIENHGVEYALQDETIRNNMLSTMLDLYDVPHAAQSEKFKKKMVDAYIKNYGVNNPSVRHITQDVRKKLDNKEWLQDQNKKHSFYPIAKSLGVSTTTLSQSFKKFGLFPVRHNNFVSGPEKEIVEFIKNINPNLEIIISDRSVLGPYEIDIYIPELNLAFEYNGLYYHSEDYGKDQHYHIYKTTECIKKGIRLIHIWENDWINSKEIILSKILYLLGKSKSIYARKCKIVEINKDDAEIFFNQTHIQGYAFSTVRLGLKLDDELVACMSFVKSRFTKSAEWELLRYSTKLNSSVTGGFSKLLQYFIKIYNSQSIISYSDKCWSVGNVYQSNGFKYFRTSKPSYFYTRDGKTIENRMSFQKKKLKDKLKIFDPDLSESENMKANKYLKIWNCGNDAWLWTSLHDGC